MSFITKSVFRLMCTPIVVLVTITVSAGLGYYLPALESATVEEARRLGEEFIQYSLIGLLIAALCVYEVYRRNVYIRLQQLVAAMEDMEEGDFSHQIEVHGNDEISALMGKLNQISLNFTSMFSKIKASADQLNDSVNSQSSLFEKTQASAQRQQEETQQVASAMTEMTATVREVAEYASAAAATATEASEGAQQGRSVVQGTTEAINDLATETEHTAAVIEKLAEDSETIGAILDVIRSIAEQTNLLALNAAIEAARAGEQGRGFAVVADEVRTLASRTQKSTEEIQTMIESLQSGANNAVKAMQGGVEKTLATVDRARKAQESLDSITESFKAITDMNFQIASAAEEQTAVAGEIDRNVSRISSLSNETTEITAETATSSQQVSAIAEELQQLVAIYKT